MDRRMKGLLVGFVALLAFVIIIDATAEEPTDWSASYVHDSNKALATEVFYENLKTLSTDIQQLKKPPFEVFQDTLSRTGTYVFINNFVNLTKEESLSLLEWVDSGNTVFIASEGIPKPLLDSLDLDVSFYVSQSEIEYQPSFNFKDQNLALKDFKTSRKPFEYSYFSEIDSTTTSLLGDVKTKKATPEEAVHTNFIEVAWGKGKFLLHLAPQVYTNYFLLDANNSDYTSRTLGYLNLNQTLFWDGYYKAGKDQITNNLYYLLSNPYLKSAYYLVILTSLLYVLFAGKRKQRAIPIRPPVKNRSYEFVQTIAGMYLDKKDHKAIAQKQITAFLEHIRSRYKVSTQEISTTFIKDLASKTNKNEGDLKKLFQYIERVTTSEIVTADDLKTLNRKITTFKS